MGNSIVKTAKNKASDSNKTSGSPGQLTLLQCGFSKLFETKYKAVEDSDGDTASDDESSDEQPTCLSTEAKDAGCQKSQGSLGISKPRRLASPLNPSEKCILGKSEKILEQNVSSESDDEKICKNPADRHCILQNISDSEDSDVILTTQYTPQEFPKKNIRIKLHVHGYEDSETENTVNV